MQIRSEYLLISSERKTQYFEVCGYIDFGVMRIRDYTSQDPKVLIECHRHHGFCPRRPRREAGSLAYSPTPSDFQSPEFAQLAGFREAGTARAATLCPVPLRTIDYDLFSSMTMFVPMKVRNQAQEKKRLYRDTA